MPDLDEEGFNLQAVYAEQARKPFRFFWADRWWTLPHLRELDYRIQSEIESTESWTVPAMLGLFGRIFGPEQAEAWDEVEVPGPAIGMLFDRYIAHSGGAPGESQGSDGSSTSTEPKSKRTSRGSTTGSASRKRSTPRNQASGTPPASSST